MTKTLLVLMSMSLGGVASVASAAERGEAIFAGGCFWCEEAAFEGVPGVTAAISGYTGGQVKNPSYEAVSSGGTGHAEAVRVLFDPAKISYAQLLEIFWHSIDPLSANGQFCDRGTQYRSGVYFLDENQRKLADESRKKVAAQLGRAVVTEITRATEFYAAEDYHQDFFRKNPARYTSYRIGCGRDRRLKELWGAAAAVGH